MNEKIYVEKLKKILKNRKALEFFKEQIKNYNDAKENYVKPNHNYEVGDLVLLKKHQLLRGEGGLSQISDDRLKDISLNGFISRDLTEKYNKNQKTPLTIPVWNIQKDILLRDYIINYSGATLKYTASDGAGGYEEITRLIPYQKLDDEIEVLKSIKCFKWNMEQTKEVRFMPSLARDNIQIGFIMTLDNPYGQKIIKLDIFDLDFDKNVLKTFISKWFIDNFLYAKRDDFTTNRESAIIFGIPVCFIEGILVGRKLEKENDKLEIIKDLFPTCYICNLEGKVIMK